MTSSRAAQHKIWFYSINIHLCQIYRSCSKQSILIMHSLLLTQSQLFELLPLKCLTLAAEQNRKSKYLTCKSHPPNSAAAEYFPLNFDIFSSLKSFRDNRWEFFCVRFGFLLFFFYFETSGKATPWK